MLNTTCIHCMKKKVPATVRGKGTVSQPSAQHEGNVSGEKLSQRWYQGMFQNKTRACDQTNYDAEKTANSLNVCGKGHK